jgi:hypothetical protein
MTYAPESSIIKFRGHYSGTQDAGVKRKRGDEVTYDIYPIIGENIGEITSPLLSLKLAITGVEGREGLYKLVKIMDFDAPKKMTLAYIKKAVKNSNYWGYTQVKGKGINKLPNKQMRDHITVPISVFLEKNNRIDKAASKSGANDAPLGETDVNQVTNPVGKYILKNVFKTQTYFNTINRYGIKALSSLSEDEINWLGNGELNKEMVTKLFFKGSLPEETVKEITGKGEEYEKIYKASEKYKIFLNATRNNHSCLFARKDDPWEDYLHILKENQARFNYDLLELSNSTPYLQSKEVTRLQNTFVSLISACEISAINYSDDDSDEYFRSINEIATKNLIITSKKRIYTMKRNIKNTLICDSTTLITSLKEIKSTLLYIVIDRAHEYTLDALSSLITQIKNFPAKRIRSIVFAGNSSFYLKGKTTVFSSILPVIRNKKECVNAISSSHRKFIIGEKDLRSTVVSALTKSGYEPINLIHKKDEADVAHMRESLKNLKYFIKHIKDFDSLMYTGNLVVDINGMDAMDIQSILNASSYETKSISIYGSGISLDSLGSVKLKVHMTSLPYTINKEYREFFDVNDLFQF